MTLVEDFTGLVGHAVAIAPRSGPAGSRPRPTRAPMALRSGSAAAGGAPMSSRAHSVGRAALRLLRAPAQQAGRVLGAGYVAFGEAVVAVEPPGAPRLPNGIVCDLRPEPGVPVSIGAGRLRVGDAAVTAGPLWDARPRVRARLATDASAPSDPLALAGLGPGLTPYGDDVLAGWLSGLVLFQGRRERARPLADAAASQTTLLSATLLRLAARGELAEPAHDLLERGDPEPLLRFGHSSGRGLLLGLALACEPGVARRARAAVTVPAPHGGEARVWVTPPGGAAAGGTRTARASR